MPADSTDLAELLRDIAAEAVRLENEEAEREMERKSSAFLAAQKRERELFSIHSA